MENNPLRRVQIYNENKFTNGTDPADTASAVSEFETPDSTALKSEKGNADNLTKWIEKAEMDEINRRDAILEKKEQYFTQKNLKELKKIAPMDRTWEEAYLLTKVQQETDEKFPFGFSDEEDTIASDSPKEVSRRLKTSPTIDIVNKILSFLPQDVRKDNPLRPNYGPEGDPDDRNTESNNTDKNQVEVLNQVLQALQEIRGMMAQGRRMNTKEHSPTSTPPTDEVKMSANIIKSLKNIEVMLAEKNR